MLRYLAIVVLALSACTTEPTADKADANQSTDTNPNRLTCADLHKLHGAKMICAINNKECWVETVLKPEGDCYSFCGNNWYYPSDELEWSGEHQITVHSPFRGTYWCAILNLPGK